MENIIVEICLAATGEIIDFMLPAHVPASALVEEITRMVMQLHQELCYQEKQTILYDLSRGAEVCADGTLAQQQVRDGTRLLLV